MLRERDYGVHTDLIHYCYQSAGVLLSVNFWIPRHNIPYNRLYICTGAMPAAQVRAARDALEGTVFPRITAWLDTILEQPEASTVLGGTSVSWRRSKTAPCISGTRLSDALFMAQGAIESDSAPQIQHAPGRAGGVCPIVAALCAGCEEERRYANTGPHLAPVAVTGHGEDKRRHRTMRPRHGRTAPAFTSTGFALWQANVHTAPFAALPRPDADAAQNRWSPREISPPAGSVV